MAAVITSPHGTRPPSRRPSSGGNWPMEDICSHRPPAGYSPALVAPAVANNAVTVIIQYPARPSTGSAATANAVPPESITSWTVSVPNTPRETAT